VNERSSGGARQLLRAKVSLAKVHAILVTHMHPDHSLGVVPLLRSMSVAGRTRHLYLTGPTGIRQLVESTLAWTSSKLHFEVVFRELDCHEPHHSDIVAFSGSSVTVTAHLLQHRVPSFGFVFLTSAVVRLDRERAVALGVQPGPALGRLQRGLDETLPDGRVVRSADVTVMRTPAQKVVVLGDTCDSSNILESARDCDLLVHEATFDASRHDLALKRQHSTSAMAGEFARAIGAKRLVLTHFSCRYFDLRLLESQQELQQAGEDSVAHDQSSADASCRSSSDEPSTASATGGGPRISVQTLVQEAFERCLVPTEAAMDLVAIDVTAAPSPQQ